MTFKKKILIGGLGFVILMIILFVLSAPKQKPATQNPLITKPSIPNYYSGNLPVEINSPEKDFNFPSRVSVFDVDFTKPFSDDEAQEIATNAGFNNTPEVSNDVNEGKTFMWAQGNENLIIYSKSRKIHFTLSDIEAIGNKQPSDDLVRKVAEKFVSDKLPNLKNNLQFSFLSYLKSDGEYLIPATKETASVYQANFSPSGSNLKTLTLYPQSSFAFAQVLENGTVSRFEAIVPASITKSPEEYTLKNYQDIVNEKSSALITSIDNGFFNFVDITSDRINNITVNKIDLVYLVDSTTPAILQPVYLFEGDMKIKGDPDLHKVELYLPAIKSL